MRNTLVRTLVEEANAGIDLHFLTGDLGFRVLDPLREAHPDRFTNVGIAEANMVSVAAGMALSGKRPVCYSMVPFVLFRAFESVRIDVVAHNLPVLLLGVGGGLSYGHEGVSHHANEDLAIARSLPGLTVLAPADPVETACAVRFALRHPGPTYLRLGQNNDPVLHAEPVRDLSSPLLIRPGAARSVVLATGHIVSDARAACERLGERAPTLLSVPSLKPFDFAALARLAETTDRIVTIEEHGPVGGLGSLIAEALFELGWRGRFTKVSLPDAYCDTHGTLPWLRKKYGLDPESLSQRIEKAIQ